MMVAVAAASGLRRSEVRGLKWKDCDLAGHWFNLKRGVVKKTETNLKTEASRRGMPMLPQLAEATHGVAASDPLQSARRLGLCVSLYSGRATLLAGIGAQGSHSSRRCCSRNPQDHRLAYVPA